SKPAVRRTCAWYSRSSRTGSTRRTRDGCSMSSVSRSPPPTRPDRGRLPTRYRRAVSGGTVGKHSVEREQKDRSEDRHDPAGGIVGAPEGPPNERADQRSRHAQQGGDDEAAGVPPRHQELRDHAHDQAEDDLSNQVHGTSRNSRSEGVFTQRS